MPLISTYKIENTTQIVLWRMSDADFKLKEILDLTPDEKKEISALTEKKQIEWITARYLIKNLTGKKYTKDTHGKPHLIESDGHISISHSHDLLVVAISKKLIGVDIQYQTPRLKKMAWRVMNAEKFKHLDTSNELLHLHIYWGAKEALYKAYGKRDLHFKNNMRVKPFLKLPTNDTHLQEVTTGTVVKNNFQKDFQIFFNRIDAYVLVIALEKI